MPWSSVYGTFAVQDHRDGIRPCTPVIVSDITKCINSMGTADRYVPGRSSDQLFENSLRGVGKEAADVGDQQRTRLGGAARHRQLPGGGRCVPKVPYPERLPAA